MVFDTPKKAYIKGYTDAIKDFENEGLLVTNFNDRLIATRLRIYRITVNRIYYNNNLRTNPTIYRETRGKKRKLSSEKYGKIIQIYNKYPKEVPNIP